MAYDEHLADRVRWALRARHVVHDEKRMMGGLCFMVDDKMCAGISGERLMARLDPAEYQDALRKDGAMPMEITGRPMKGFVFVAPEAIDDEAALAWWIERCLAYNPVAPRSRKRRR